MAQFRGIYTHIALIAALLSLFGFGCSQSNGLAGSEEQAAQKGLATNAKRYSIPEAIKKLDKNVYNALWTKKKWRQKNYWAASAVITKDEAFAFNCEDALFSAYYNDGFSKVNTGEFSKNPPKSKACAEGRSGSGIKLRRNQTVEVLGHRGSGSPSWDIVKIRTSSKGQEIFTGIENLKLTGAVVSGAYEEEKYNYTGTCSIDFQNGRWQEVNCNYDSRH
jgi:hypothetical protein